MEREDSPKEPTLKERTWNSSHDHGVDFSVGENVPAIFLINDSPADPVFFFVYSFRYQVHCRQSTLQGRKPSGGTILFVV